MKSIFFIVLTLSLLIGCSQKKDETPAILNNPYPRDAATVVTNSDYVSVYKGEQSGITYYLRRLTRDEANKFPDDKVIFGDRFSVVFVPIKDGKIVNITPEDHMIVGSKAAAIIAQ